MYGSMILLPDWFLHSLYGGHPNQTIDGVALVELAANAIAGDGDKSATIAKTIPAPESSAADAIATQLDAVEAGNQDDDPSQ